MEKQADKNVTAAQRVDAKAYEEMNMPMTGVPEQDNITILDDKPPLFHSIPEYDIENNPFSFLYVDMTYDCNMECEFCYNPVRTYSTLDIEWFEDVCARLPHPVNFRLLGGEPTLYPDLERALDACTKYGHQAAVVTNGLRLASMNYAKKLKAVLDRNPTVNVSLTMNGGMHPIKHGDLLLLERITPEHAGSISGKTVAIERQGETGDEQYLLRNV
jgi:sulfatase maturation enzyme AslB (radical SAM superfamily)